MATPSKYVKQKLGGDEESELKLVELLDDMRDRQKALRAPLLEAERNELWVFGNQNLDIADDWNLHSIDLFEDHQSRFTRNYLRHLAHTWTARFLKDRPRAFAWPGAAEVSDIQAAQIANAILREIEEQHQFDAMDFRAVMLAQCHGSVGFKVCWDTLKGPPSDGFVLESDEVDPFTGEVIPVPQVDEFGDPVLVGVGEPQGDVRIDIVSVFNFWTDGAEDVEDSEWCIFRSYIDEPTARAVLRNAGHKAVNKMDLDACEYTTIWGEQKRGVEVFELWYLPCPRFPEGIFASVVGGHVADNRPYPYAHRQLPLSVFKINDRRDSPFGTTHVTDAVPIQRELNEAISIRAMRVREMAVNTKLICVQEIYDAFEGGDGILVVPTLDYVQGGAKWLEPPGPSPLLEKEIANKKEELFDVFGLNELMTGQETMGKRTAGKSIAFINELDSMKIAGAVRSFQKAIHRRSLQILELYKQFVVAPRIIRIVGERAEQKVFDFIGADVSGVDIRLEPTSGHGELRGSKAAEAEDAAAAGALDPQRAAEIVKTGLDETAFDSAQSSLITGMIGEVLRGGSVAADPNVDPLVAVRELQKAIAENTTHPALNVLQQMLIYYQQQASQKQGAPLLGPMAAPQAMTGPGGSPV